MQSLGKPWLMAETKNYTTLQAPGIKSVIYSHWWRLVNPHGQAICSWYLFLVLICEILVAAVTFHGFVCYSVGCVGLSFCQSGGCYWEERLIVTGKMKMSDLYWRWGTKPCTVILVIRTTERITPVHVHGKQIKKVTVAEAKIRPFGLKFSASD